MNAKFDLVKLFDLVDRDPKIGWKPFYESAQPGVKAEKKADTYSGFGISA